MNYPNMDILLLKSDHHCLMVIYQKQKKVLRTLMIRWHHLQALEYKIHSAWYKVFRARPSNIHALLLQCLMQT